MGWVSVKDRLPESDLDEVLCSDGNVSFVGSFWSKFQRFDFDDASYWRHSVVVYWMEIPPTPNHNFYVTF